MPLILLCREFDCDCNCRARSRVMSAFLFDSSSVHSIAKYVKLSRFDGSVSKPCDFNCGSVAVCDREIEVAMVCLHLSMDSVV